jgi:excisionase family DNA binding protein
MSNTNDKAECLILSVEAAGRRLGLSRATAYSYANQGIIPALRLGTKKLVVPVKALEKLLEQASNKAE